MIIEKRTAELRKSFSLDHPIVLEESGVEIHPFSFHQVIGNEDIDSFQRLLPTAPFCDQKDCDVRENRDFTYTVFLPKGSEPSDHAILLLHGLNERSWGKYLPWAEQLTLMCGVPVILFPIAFHMNRTPNTWYSPRWITPWMERRMHSIADVCNCSFFNTALSSRLTESPLRFYISGRQSVFNLWQLLLEVKSGAHPLFRADCNTDIFAYSVGALLAEVLLMSNPNNLLSTSKLFTFCGGSIFEKMNGNSREIMDEEANDIMRRYYLNDFLPESESDTADRLPFSGDAIETAFKTMITPAGGKEQREAFFCNASDRIRMVTLKKDCVIPTEGSIEAVGKRNAEKIVTELDFPFNYTHQSPFPVNNLMIPSEELNGAFTEVFSRAAEFLA